MRKLLSLSLPLVSLGLAVHCGFRFDNPVEQCPSSGCESLDVSLPRSDAGSPDAGIPDGATGEDTGPAFWFEPAATVDEIAHISGYGYLSVGIDGTDEPFVLNVVPGQTHSAATRSRGAWTWADLGITGGEAAVTALSGSLPSGFIGGRRSVLVLEPELLYVERPSTTWDVYRVVAPAAGCTEIVGAPGLGGSIEVVAVCAGALRHGHWNGDRISHVQIGWQDLGPGTGIHIEGLWSDSTGGLHVLLDDTAATELVYLRREQGQSWNREVLASGFNGGAIGTLDPRGDLAFCTLEAAAAVDAYSARWTRRVTDQWVSRALFVNEKHPYFWPAGLAFDRSDRMHLLARSELPGLGCCSASRWVESGADWQVTDYVRTQGFSELIVSDLALDSTGIAHFAVSDGSRLYHLEIGP